ncbi:MAG: hypothetical protein RR246_04945, partial [Clostridia bacterium]
MFFAIFLFSPSLHDNANTHSENHSFDSENSHFAASNYTNSDLSHTTDFSIDASKNEKEVASIICSDRITIKSGQTNALITFQNPIFSKYSVKFKIVGIRYIKSGFSYSQNKIYFNDAILKKMSFQINQQYSKMRVL